jgi:hypothetical protein
LAHGFRGFHGQLTALLSACDDTQSSWEEEGVTEHSCLLMVTWKQKDLKQLGTRHALQRLTSSFTSFS